MKLPFIQCICIVLCKFIIVAAVEFLSSLEPKQNAASWWRVMCLNAASLGHYNGGLIVS